MLTVRTSFGSPFGRKARIAVSVLGLDGKVKVESATTTDPSDPLRKQNPLGKIPVLILDDGSAIYDSPVILEYLDHLAGGGKILPKDFNARLAALKLQALADGIMDAALLQVYEGRFRPEDRHEPKWVSHQADKVRRGLDHAEAHLSETGQDLHIGQIALACALGYLDLRFAGRWRESYPKLVAWLGDFESRVPAFAKTRVTP